MAVLGTLWLSPLNAADLKCEFHYYTDLSTDERFAYTCKDTEELPVNDHTVTNVIGDHLYRDASNTVLFTNADVEIVEIQSKVIAQIPRGLHTVFPKLSKLSISPKLPGISQNDFVDLKQLTKLTISVDNLPVNVFDDLENLEELTLENSGLTLLPPMVFHKLTQLEVLKVNGNNQNFIVARRAAKLIELPANLFQTNFNLREIHFHNNGLTCIHDELLSGLDKLESVSIIQNCITENYPSVTLTVLKNKIHLDCQECQVLVPIVDPPPPEPVAVSILNPVRPEPCNVGEPGCLLPQPATIGGLPGGLLPGGLPWAKPSPDSDACTLQLKQLHAEYNKLKAQKNCNSRQKIELIFKHNQN